MDKKKSAKRRNQAQHVPRDPVGREYANVVRSMDRTNSRVNTVHRIFTILTTVSTNASGYIPQNQYDTGSLTGTVDWSMANRYTEYRVKSMRVRWFPIVTEIQSATSTYTVIPAPGPIVGAVYANTYGYGSVQLRLAGSEVQLFLNGRIVDKTVDAKGYPDAALWTPTNAAIAADSRFGIEFSDLGNGPTSAVSTVYYRVLVQYLTELRLPQ